MTVLKIFLATAWLVIAFITARAAARLGVGAIAIFFSDFSQPWRAQFNTDFTFHLLLIAGWVLYREKSRRTGVLCGIGVILVAAFFRWRTFSLRPFAQKTTCACSFWETTQDVCSMTAARGLSYDFFGSRPASPR